MFHKSNFGAFSSCFDRVCDINGYVPESGDSFESFNYAADIDEEDFGSIVEEAADALARAEAAIEGWRGVED